MRTKGKALAKSLHTVSVLRDVALYAMRAGNAATSEEAVGLAVALLGLSEAEDVYGLRDAALRQLPATYLQAQGKVPSKGFSRVGEAR